MSSPWSPRREVSPQTSRLLIERAHEELVAGNDADRRMRDVRPLVQESWRRSLASLVGAEGLPPLDLASAELEEYRRAHPLASVMDMIRALLLPGEAAESGVVVAVGDAAGRLLWVEGDHHIRTLTGDMGFVAGANWSEGAVGTSAPGTSLALDRSVQIRGAEHFNRLVQPWSCTAVPVHDPESRRILGVIDVTGGDEVITPQAQLLVDATARAIEGELLVARLRARAEQPRQPPRRRIAAARRPRADRVTLRVLGPRPRAARGRPRRVRDGLRARSAPCRAAAHARDAPAGRVGRSARRARLRRCGCRGRPSTLRAEMVRLRKVLEKTAPALVPESRPYRLAAELETDAQQVLSLLDRGAHRVALAAYRGDVLPDSTAPGWRSCATRSAPRCARRCIAEASVDVLLAFAETDAGAEDEELLRLCLKMLPARSPKRAALVSRIERLEASA